MTRQVLLVALGQWCTNQLLQSVEDERRGKMLARDVMRQQTHCHIRTIMREELSSGVLHVGRIDAERRDSLPVLPHGFLV